MAGGSPPFLVSSGLGLVGYVYFLLQHARSLTSFSVIR